MNRRRFLSWLGLGTAAPVLAPVNLAWRAPTPTPPSPDALTETLDVRVYGWVYGGREVVLLRRAIPVRREYRQESGTVVFLGPPDLSLDLTGPVTVTRIVLETPAAVRRARAAVGLPAQDELPFRAPSLPHTARAGETVTLLLPDSRFFTVQ